MGTVTLATQTAPSTPSAGNIIIYAKNDGLLYWKDSVGTEYTINTSTVIGWQAAALNNFTLVTSVGSSALTIAVKGIDGNDPSSTNTVNVPFRSSTASSGDIDVLSLTAATSITVSSGSTLGASNSTAFRIWVVGFNDAGTFRLGVINTLSGVNIYQLAPWGIASSTAEGGAGAADSAQVFYTGTAVSSKPYTILGYVTYESGLATAGTYNAVPTRAQVYIPGNPTPGQTVQTVISQTGAAATGTTTVPHDDTIPQNTEGDQYMSQAITPSSAANVLVIDSAAYTASNTGDIYLVIALFQDTTANALKALDQEVHNAGGTVIHNIHHEMLSGTSSSTTFKIRLGPSSAATLTFNGSGGGRIFGGVAASYLRVLEVMS